MPMTHRDPGDVTDAERARAVERGLQHNLQTMSTFTELYSSPTFTDPPKPESAEELPADLETMRAEVITAALVAAAKAETAQDAINAALGAMDDYVGGAADLLDDLQPGVIAEAESAVAQMWETHELLVSATQKYSDAAGVPIETEPTSDRTVSLDDDLPF